MAADWEIWNSVLDRASREGISALSPVERTIYRVNCYLCDLTNGGLSGLLFNLSPATGSPLDWHELRETAQSLHQLGDRRSAQLLERCAERLENVPLDTSNSWNSVLTVAFGEDQDRIAAELLDLEPTGWELLSTFTTQNKIAP